MEKVLKRIAISLIALILLFALFLAAWAFLIYPNLIADPSAADETNALPELAESSERLDYNSENGVLYVNNEIIVFLSDGATSAHLASLLSDFTVEIDEAMADIGAYRLCFADKMTYDELESLVKRLKSDSLVVDAYLNAAFAVEEDAAESEDDFTEKSARFPNDPWNGDGWNLAVPRGANWGMEAIEAPAAWGYLDELSTVRVGLIDSVPNASHADLNVANSTILYIDEDSGKTSVNNYSASVGDHGTHVAGIMNATWNNKTGVSGVMGGKGELYYSAVYYVSDGQVSSKYATAYSYLLALKTLIDQDVQVINISQNTSRLVGFAASHGNENAINYLTMQANLAERGLARIIAAREAAGKPDFVICVAAGNSNSTYYYADSKQTYGYRTKMTDWESVKWLFGWRGEIGNSQALYNNFLNLMDEPEVQSRVIVVGAVGIDAGNSTNGQTRYEYADYSNVGSRVDIVAPGGSGNDASRWIYSCVGDGYDQYCGTSMAAPHVSGAAGLAFAANPNLTGPEVKAILLASTTGRYYHGASYSGLLNVKNVVITALKTKDSSVGKVLKTETDSGLDLCFVVDTTGSMGDDIDNARENMERILAGLSEKTKNYRVALVDYRDYSSRTGKSEDYPSCVQLAFTDDDEAILAAIRALDLGYGGDEAETVYSGLMAAVGLDWRENAKKVVIILGDAAPLDPEPVTDYTYEDVLLALFNADINLDYPSSDDRVVDGWEDSLINVFAIGTDASTDAADFFAGIAEETGGGYVGVEDASQVGEAIMDSIEQIEIVELLTVQADFGTALAHKQIALYSESGYLFTLEADGDGRILLENMEAGSYRWSSDGVYSGGTLEIAAELTEAKVERTARYWFAPLVLRWNRNTGSVVLLLLVLLALCILTPVLIRRARKRAQQRREAAAAVPPTVEPEPVQTPEPTSVPTFEPAAELATPETPTAEFAVRFCPKCGAKTIEGAKFCEQCGSALHGEENKTEA